MSGAILPYPHMPSWCAQGQLYLTNCDDGDDDSDEDNAVVVVMD
jgi:hypothetical protein